MTENYKENLLKYLTGNIAEEEPGETLVYENPNIITTDLATTLSAEFTNGYTITNIIESRNINGNTLNYNVLYGYYTKATNTTRGFVVIIDERGNLVQLIKEYSSGAEIGRIFSMKVDEEGYFYALEINPTNDRRRFLMFNNIVIRLQETDEFKIHIRKSYQVPDTSKLYEELVMDMTKAIGQAKYLIAGAIDEESGVGIVPCVTELTINVGAENDWIDYVGTQWTHPDSGSLSAFSTLAIYGIWTSDSLDFTLLTHPSRFPEYIIKYYKDGDTMPYENIYAAVRDIQGTGSRWAIKYNIINNNLAYLTEGMHQESWGSQEKHRLYTIDLENNTISILYEQEGYYDTNDQIVAYCAFQYSIIDGELVFANTYCDNNSKCHIEIGRLRDDAYIPSGTYGNISTYEIAEINSTNPPYIAKFFINKQFNLYNYNLLLGDTNYNGIEVYNSNNYNGEPYEDVNSLLSNSGILYDSNDIAIFARNLYDRVITGNITTSIIDIPNTFLNDVEIAKENLLSETNDIMVSNEDTITKNIYEELLLNFINTITMQNQNDPDNIITNLVGATRVNTSSSNLLDYNAAKATKYRINYEDETTSTGDITWTSTGNYFTTEFSVFNPANNIITSIDIISADGNTTYLTIDTSDFEGNKKYTINQDVYIDEKVNE